MDRLHVLNRCVKCVRKTAVEFHGEDEAFVLGYIGKPPPSVTGSERVIVERCVDLHAVEELAVELELAESLALLRRVKNRIPVIDIPGPHADENGVLVCQRDHVVSPSRCWFLSGIFLFGLDMR